MPEYVEFSGPASTPLSEVRQFYRNSLDNGVVCPCCNRKDARYRRSLNSGMAAVLIAVYRWFFVNVSEEYCNIVQILADHHDPAVCRKREYGKLVHWGLLGALDRGFLENANDPKWWITDDGQRFVEDTNFRVPKYAYIYHRECDYLSNETINIIEALGNHFNYAELMGGQLTRDE